MNVNKAGILGIGLLALSLAIPVPVNGQQAVAIQAVNGDRAVASSKAAELRAEAVELYATRQSNWNKVVRLHLLAAKASPTDDPERIQDFWMAGAVSEALGNLEEAEQYMEKAADLAMKFEDNFRAGEIYLAAAIIAARLGDYRQANRMLDHADKAADPDLIDQEKCDCLKQRIAMLRGGGF